VALSVCPMDLNPISGGQTSDILVDVSPASAPLSSLAHTGEVHT
jgi:hypothetical protein